MLNKVLLIGRLTKDIELKSNEKTNYVQNTLAVQRGYKNKDGGYDADFVNITLFRSQADYLNNYGEKGMLVSVVGRLQQDTYFDQNAGKNVSKLNVICEEISLLERKKEKSQENASEKPIKKAYEKPIEDLTPFDDLFR